jgi:isopentenyl-diphosphate delta-isomerase
MVILTDEFDNVTGAEEKIKAHKEGLLHRAISVIIMNSKNEMLIHKRAKEKYHSPGLWTNACCTHPLPGEDTKNAAVRRLNEEMGLKTDLEFLFKFKYFVEFDNGLTEHEIDHVFVGYSDDIPKLNKDEAEDYKYAKLNTLREEIKNDPILFTEWFKIIADKLKDYEI